MHKSWSAPVGPVAPSLSDSARRWIAHALHAAGALLHRWARAWQPPAAELPQAAEARLEFHAEAGAPEGALYLDGRRIGVLPGVTRLSAYRAGPSGIHGDGRLQVVRDSGR